MKVFEKYESQFSVELNSDGRSFKFSRTIAGRKPDIKISSFDIDIITGSYTDYNIDPEDIPVAKEISWSLVKSDIGIENLAKKLCRYISYGPASTGKLYFYYYDESESKVKEDYLTFVSKKYIYNDEFEKCILLIKTPEEGELIKANILYVDYLNLSKYIAGKIFQKFKKDFSMYFDFEVKEYFKKS